MKITATYRVDDELDVRLARAFSAVPLDPWQLAKMLHADLEDVIHHCKLYLATGQIEVAEWHKYEPGITLPAFQWAGD